MTPTRLLVSALLLALPFVAYPNLGPVKLYDLLFLLVIASSWSRPTVRIPKYPLLITAVFAVEAAYGFYHINYFEHLNVLGGWNTGLQSERTYHIVTVFRVALYILGSAVAGKEIVAAPKYYMGLIYKGFVAYCWFFIAVYLFPPTHALASMDEQHIFLSAAFTEKGPFGNYAVIVTAILLTYWDAFDKGAFGKWGVAILLGTLVAVLLLSKSDRAVLLIAAYVIAFLLTRPRQTLVKIAPIAVVVLLLMTPGFASIGDKFGVLQQASSSQDSALGRYAGLILFPRVFGSSPVFGVGYGNYVFYRASTQYAQLLPVLATKDEPENFYLKTLMETGIVGFLIIGGLIVAKPAAIVWKAGEKRIRPLLIVYLVYLTAGITEFYQVWVFLFIMLAVAKLAEQRPCGPIASATAPSPAKTDENAH